MLSNTDKGGIRLASTIPEERTRILASTTKKLRFRERISSSAYNPQEHSQSATKTGEALLKVALKHAKKPPCGVEDPPPNTPRKQSTLSTRLHSRHRRYAVQGSKLNGPLVTWNVPSSSWSTKLSQNDVNKTLEKAFRIWAEVIPLKFRWVDQNADITIIFGTCKYGRFQSSFRLCFKASSRAKPFIWKLVLFTCK